MIPHYRQCYKIIKTANVPLPAYSHYIVLQTDCRIVLVLQRIYDKSTQYIHAIYCKITPIYLINEYVCLQHFEMMRKLQKPIYKPLRT